MGMDERVGRIESDIKELKDDVKELEREDSQLKEVIQELKESIIRLNSNLSNINTIAKALLGLVVGVLIAVFSAIILEVLKLL